MSSVLPRSLEECRISRSRQQQRTKNSHRSSLPRMEGFRCMTGRRQRRSCSGRGNRPAGRETERRPCCVRIPFLKPHNTVRRRCRRERLSMENSVRKGSTSRNQRQGKPREAVLAMVPTSSTDIGGKGRRQGPAFSGTIFPQKARTDGCQFAQLTSRASLGPGSKSCALVCGFLTSVPPLSFSKTHNTTLHFTGRCSRADRTRERSMIASAVFGPACLSSFAFAEGVLANFTLYPFMSDQFLPHWSLPLPSRSRRTPRLRPSRSLRGTSAFGQPRWEDGV